MSKELLVESEETKKTLSERNALAIGETLENQAEVIADLQMKMAKQESEIAMLKSDLSQQKQMIIRSLQQKYGNGPTSS